MADRGSTPSNPPTLADRGVGATQVIDLVDIDLSGVLPEERRLVPPPLPPEEIARASQLPSVPPPSLQPSASMPVGAPAPAGRSTGFYLVVLAACLVVFVGAGALVARSMRSAPPAPAAAPAAPEAVGATATPAARVITISPVEMTDEVDAGTAKKKK